MSDLLARITSESYRAENPAVAARVRIPQKVIQGAETVVWNLDTAAKSQVALWAIILSGISSANGI